jgi:hypothetical protein
MRSWTYKPEKGFPKGDVLDMENSSFRPETQTRRSRDLPPLPPEQYHFRGNSSCDSSSSSSSMGSPMINIYKGMDRPNRPTPHHRRHPEGFATASRSAPSTPKSTHRLSPSWPESMSRSFSAKVRPERASAVHQGSKNHPVGVTFRVKKSSGTVFGDIEGRRSRRSLTTSPQRDERRRTERRVYESGSPFTLRECDVKHPVFILYVILVFLVMIKMAIVPHHRLMQAQAHELKST